MDIIIIIMHEYSECCLKWQPFRILPVGCDRKEAHTVLFFDSLGLGSQRSVLITQVNRA